MQDDIFTLNYYIWSKIWSWKGDYKMARHGSNIRKRKDGRWEGRYRLLQADNSYKYKSVYGKTCGEVKEKLKNVLSQQSQKTLQEESADPDSKAASESFGVIAEKWLQEIRETRKYSTYMKYRGIYEKYIKDAVGNSSICDISIRLINEYIFLKERETKISQNLKYTITAVTNQILKYASENYEYPQTQLTNKFIKDKGKKIDVINHSEQAALIRYLHKETDASKAGILLCIFTGLRLGEICSLKWEDIDFEQMIIHVNRTVQRVTTDGDESKTVLIITEPKSSFSKREIPISEGTAQILREIKYKGEYIVGGKKPLDPRTYQNRFKKYLKDNTIKNYNFHALRHTFATNCIDHNMDVKSLSEILGHANVQITLNRYVHPSMDTKRRQIAVLDTVYGQIDGRQE